MLSKQEADDVFDAWLLSIEAAVPAATIQPKRPPTTPKTHPRRAGYADAVLGRPCSSPWKGFSGMKRTAEYILGYMDGEDALRRSNKPL